MVQVNFKPSGEVETIHSERTEKNRHTKDLSGYVTFNVSVIYRHTSHCGRDPKDGAETETVKSQMMPIFQTLPVEMG